MFALIAEIGASIVTSVIFASTRSSKAWSRGLASEQGLHAGHLVLQGLLLVRAGIDLDGGVNPRAAHGVNRLVAGLDRSEHRLPLALDRRAVGVQLDLEARFSEHLLAGGDVGGQVHAHPDRHHT